MRRRPAALLLALALSTALTACGGESTTVTDEGVVETPSGTSGGAEPGAGIDAPSGEPLAPDSSAEPGAEVTTAPTPSG